MHDLSWLTARPIAHRGLHDLNRERWENTLAAFSAAMDADYAIECDVRASADGVPVIFHDEDLQRLTGREGKVWQHGAAELEALEIGGTGEHIPTLVSTLEHVAGRVPLVIEIKGAAGHDEGLAGAVVGCLAGYEGHVALMSFDHWIIRALGSLASHPVGLTASGRATSDMEAHFSMLAHNIAFASYCVEDLPNPFVAFLRERLSMPVITWTVRDQDMAQRSARYADQMTFEGFSP